MTSPYLIADTVEPGIPEGFKRLEAGGPYFRQMGPAYLRLGDDGKSAVLALRVCSQSPQCPGRLLTAACSPPWPIRRLGMNLSLARGRRGGQVTVSLTADFLSGAREGDWLEAHVVITRMGKRLAYANCDLKVGGRHVLRSSAVFAIVDRALPKGAGQLPPLQDG